MDAGSVTSILVFRYHVSNCLIVTCLCTYLRHSMKQESFPTITTCGLSTLCFFILCLNCFTHSITVTSISPRAATTFPASRHGCLERHHKVSKNLVSVMSGFDCSALSQATLNTQVQRAECKGFVYSWTGCPPHMAEFYELFMYTSLDNNFASCLLQLKLSVMLLEV